MRSKQKGMTMIGWIMTLVVIGFFALFAIRLIPVFLEYQSISSAMNALTEEPVNSAVDIQRSLGKRLDINAVNVVNARDFKIAKGETGLDVSIVYDARTGFIANIDLLVHFEKTVTVPSR